MRRVFPYQSFVARKSALCCNPAFHFSLLVRRVYSPDLFDYKKDNSWFQPKSSLSKQRQTSDMKTGTTSSRSSELSQKSVADMLGMGKGGDDAFLEIGSNVPMGSTQTWDDNINDWVISSI